MTSVEASWMGRIVSSPDILHGQARIAGTRIPVEVILDNLASGASWQEIIEDYPPITEADIQAVLEYTSYLEKNRRLVSGNYHIPHYIFTSHYPYELVENIVQSQLIESNTIVARNPDRDAIHSIENQHLGIITKFSNIIHKDTITTQIDQLFELMSDKDLDLVTFINRVLFIYACGEEYHVSERVIGMLIKKFYNDSGKMIKEFGRIKSNDLFLIDGKKFYIQNKGMMLAAIELLDYLDNLSNDHTSSNDISK